MNNLIILNLKCSNDNTSSDFFFFEFLGVEEFAFHVITPSMTSLDFEFEFEFHIITSSKKSADVKLQKKFDVVFFK